MWPRKGLLMKIQTRILDNRLYYTRKIELHRKGKKSRTVRITPILICSLAAKSLVLITVRKVHYGKMGKAPIIIAKLYYLHTMIPKSIALTITPRGHPTSFFCPQVNGFMYFKLTNISVSINHLFAHQYFQVLLFKCSNATSVICLHTVKWLQVLLLNINHSIQLYLFISLLSGSKYCYVSLIIQLNISHLFTQSLK